MSIRSRVDEAVKQAMRDKDKARLTTLRLVSAYFKDLDVAARGKGDGTPVGEDVLLAGLGKMVKQRQESAKAFDEGDRAEMAEKERAEIAVIEEFLPAKLSEAEVENAIAEAIAEVGAESLRDMGKVMGVLKGKYTGQLDFGAVGALVKARLG